MKFILIGLLTTGFFLHSNAQTQLAIKAGFNYSTARAYYNDIKQSVGFVPGAYFGLQLKTVFDGPLHFTPFVGYNSRGFIITSKDSGNKIRNFIHYIDIAPLLSFDIATASNNKFVITAGPVASLAVAGTQKTTISGVTNKSRMKFSTTDDYGYFDFAMKAGIGYQFKKLFIEAAYQLGLANINNRAEFDKKNIRNRTFSLGIGYYFKSYQ